MVPDTTITKASRAASVVAAEGLDVRVAIDLPDAQQLWHAPRPGLARLGPLHLSGRLRDPEGHLGVEELEVATAWLAGRVFAADHAEIRVASGAMANLYAFMATCAPGDPIIVPPATIAGHVTHNVGGAAELYRRPDGWRIAWAQPLRGDRPWSHLLTADVTGDR